MKKEALYLLRLPCFISGNLSTCLKFGYSSDIENRMGQYKDYYPEFYKLKRYDGGTMEDESRVIIYLSKYCISGREFFKDCPEVLEFFETNDTLERIRNVTSYITVTSRQEKKSNRFYFWPYISCVCDVIGEGVGYDSLLESLIFYCDHKEESVLGYLGNRFPDYFPMILQKYEDWFQISDKMIKFIDYLRDPKNGKLSDRLKLLCNTKEFTEEEKRVIAKQTSEKFDRYYNILGPERCIKVGYNVTDLNKEISDSLVDKNIIAKEFYNNFKVGSKYSRKDAKEIVKNIFDRLGLNIAPKASLLEEYFEVKEMKVKLDDGSWINGFKILSIKGVGT